MVKTALCLLALLLPFAAQAQSPKADLQCKSTGTDFVYDCAIRLRRGRKPLEGVQITVSADMPSMPMAHLVKPRKARPGTMPGEYHVRLDLEMLGEWAVELRLGGPVRDRLILHYEFDSTGAAPIRK